MNKVKSGVYLISHFGIALVRLQLLTVKQKNELADQLWVSWCKEATKSWRRTHKWE